MAPYFKSDTPFPYVHVWETTLLANTSLSSDSQVRSRGRGRVRVGVGVGVSGGVGVGVGVGVRVSTPLIGLIGRPLITHGTCHLAYSTQQSIRLQIVGSDRVGLTLTLTPTLTSGIDLAGLTGVSKQVLSIPQAEA